VIEEHPVQIVDAGDPIGNPILWALPPDAADFVYFSDISLCLATQGAAIFGALFA
jgi:hypothetical protein